jgi:hypothetical protein
MAKMVEIPMVELVKLADIPALAGIGQIDKL